MGGAAMTLAASGLSLSGLGASMSNDIPTGRKAPEAMTADERAAFQKRASEIGAKIDSAKSRHAMPNRRDSSQGNAMARGLKVTSELVGGILVGSVLGWLLDKWLGTFPWLFILFFLLGFAAGMLSIIRQAQREKTPPAPSVKDDDEDDK
jgi:ATP synthase protein I